MKKAFTLAEILITLTIIGIVAVMVIPALTTSINEKAWETQRRALHTRMSQALAQIDDLSGYGAYSETKDEDGNVTSVNDTVSESFVTQALSKVYKIKNTCDVKHLSDCGIADDFYTISGGNITTPKTILELTGITGLSKYAPAAVETGNGESLLVYYNKDCVSGAPDIPFYSTSPMCVNIIYDLNGIDGPNRIGKDMGVITAYFKNNPVVVAPMPITSNASDGSAPSYADDDNNAAGLCKKKNQESRLPDREEAASLYYNNKIFNITLNTIYWTGSIVSPGKYGLAWARGSANASISYNSISYWGSYIVPYSRSNSAAVRCIKK